MGEALAYGTLCVEGTKIRLSGQTANAAPSRSAIRFSTIRRPRTATSRSPTFSPTQGVRYEVINSMLGRGGARLRIRLPLARPNALHPGKPSSATSANGAQVVFDQFISSGERKWLRMSGLVCLLPHGEVRVRAPSARLERFLCSSARKTTAQVANVSRRLRNYFILRRQVKRDFRKPLIMMTPKSLLRHKRAVSSLSEMAGESSFHRLLDDAEVIKDGLIKLQKDAKIRRVDVLGQGLLRPAGRARGSAASTTSTCCVWNSSIRSRPRR